METEDWLTVSRLVELLQAHDQDARVVVVGTEGGLFDLKDATAAVINLHVNTFAGAGPHDHATLVGHDAVRAVVLSHLD